MILRVLYMSLWLYTAHTFEHNSQYIKYDMYLERHAAIKAVHSFPLKLVAKHVATYICSTLYVHTYEAK